MLRRRGGLRRRRRASGEGATVTADLPPACCPQLPLTEWEATKNTLHLWVQIVGKVRMASTAPRNHWWHATLYVDARGLTTRRMHQRRCQLRDRLRLHRASPADRHERRRGRVVRARRRALGGGVRRAAARGSRAARDRRRDPRVAVRRAHDDALPGRSRARSLRPRCRRAVLAHPRLDGRGVRGVLGLVLREDEPGAPVLALARPRRDALRRGARAGAARMRIRSRARPTRTSSCRSASGRATRTCASRRTTRTRRRSPPASASGRCARTRRSGRTRVAARSRGCPMKRCARPSIPERRCSPSWRARTRPVPPRGIATTSRRPGARAHRSSAISSRAGVTVRRWV